MTEALEIRTPHADVSALVRELAAGVDDLSIRLPCERPIAAGQWVRFTVLLADGSAVFEGIGRAEGSRPEGPRYRVHLSELSFDARNEIMYERMLIARDAAEETGTIDLNEVGAELVRGPSRSAPPPPPPARRPSAMPPPLPRASTAPPRPSAPGRPAPRPTTPPPKPARPLKRVKPTPAARPATASPSAGGAADLRALPVEQAREPRPVRPARVGVTPTVVNKIDTLLGREESGLRLEVPPRLVAQASALAPSLSRHVDDPHASPV